MTTEIPKTMKAAIIHKIGNGTNKEVASSDYITVEDSVKVPQEVKPDQILIRVKAAAINPVDWKILAGQFPGKKPGQGFGFDVSGVVVKVGSSCSRLKVGDEVYADIIKTSTIGSFSEYCVCEEIAASIKPTNISFEEAASIPLAGLTALQGLTTQGQLQPNQKVLIFGGSGGVGSLAVQIAKNGLNASEVHSTGSTDILKIKELGADYVINYKKQNLMDAFKDKQFDLVYDTVGGYEHWQVGQACLKKDGRYVTIAGDGPGTSFPMLVAKVLWRKFVSLVGYGPQYTIFLTDSTSPAVTNDMNKLSELIEKGQLKPVLDGRTCKDQCGCDCQDCRNGECNCKCSNDQCDCDCQACKNGSCKCSKAQCSCDCQGCKNGKCSGCEVCNQGVYKLTTKSIHEMIKASMSHHAKGKLVLKVAN
jgi:NADPH:quinone reductase-like Zn-dependent oxidoreductase